MTEPTTTLMKVREVAEELSCGISSVYRWRDQGLIRARTIGKRSVRFERDDVEAFKRSGVPAEERGAEVLPMRRGRRG